MLDILNYKTSEKDTNRLDYAVKTFGRQDTFIRKSKLGGSTMDSFVGAADDKTNMNNLFGAQSAAAIQAKLSELGLGLPQLDANMDMMQTEM
jgi:hypothetical protein